MGIIIWKKIKFPKNLKHGEEEKEEIENSQLSLYSFESHNYHSNEPSIVWAGGVFNHVFQDFKN